MFVDQTGSGLSTSPHNAPDEISMSKFPYVRIGDDVVDVLGHLGLFAVAPTSMPQVDQHLGELLPTKV